MKRAFVNIDINSVLKDLLRLPKDVKIRDIRVDHIKSFGLGPTLEILLEGDSLPRGCAMSETEPTKYREIALRFRRHSYEVFDGFYEMEHFDER